MPTKAYNIYSALHLDDFTLSAFTSYTRIPSAYSNNTNNAIYNKEVAISQSVTNIAATYKKSIGRIHSSTLFTTAGYLLSPRSNYRNLYTAMEPAYKYAGSLSLKAEEQLDYVAGKKLNFTGGASYEFFNAIPQSADLASPVNTRKHIAGSYAGTSSYYRPQGLPANFYVITYHNVGSYFQTQYAPGNKLHFTLGARYDYNSRYGETFNPRLGAVYTISSKTTLKVLYGSAFMAPPPSTVYAQWGSFATADSGKTYSSSFLHLPNPDLKPIKSQNVEVNLTHYLTDNLSVSAVGYYTALKNLYVFADDNLTTQRYNNMFNGIPVSYVEVFINEGKQESYGGNLQIKYKHTIGHIFFNSYASVSYVNGTVVDHSITATSRESELPFIAPFMFRVGTDIKKGKFSCSPRLLLMGRQNIPGVDDTTAAVITRQTIAGYALLNLSARYEFGKNFSVFLNVTNALNQKYRAVGFNMDLNKPNTDLFYGQLQDPIRFMGGLNLTF
jgi:iron complex outermembrane receptor protein